MRLFTAIYPPPHVLDDLDAAIDMVAGPLSHSPGPGLRWVPREQRHVTLAFHGEVPDGLVPGYVEELAREVGSPLRMSLAGAGVFNGRTLWAGVGTGADDVRVLARLADDVAAESGIRADEQAGARPHMTLVRASASRGRERRGSTPELLAMWAHAFAVYRGPEWEVTEIRVVQSELGQGKSAGPLHTTLAAIPLTQPLGL